MADLKAYSGSDRGRDLRAYEGKQLRMYQGTSLFAFIMISSWMK